MAMTDHCSNTVALADRETFWQDEGCDDNPCDTEERLCRVFRRDEFLCATGFGKGEVQRIKRRQAKGAGFCVSLGN